MSQLIVTNYLIIIIVVYCEPLPPDEKKGIDWKRLGDLIGCTFTFGDQNEDMENKVPSP